MSENPFEGADVLWVVHIGKDDRIALRAVDEGFVCIGWTDMGDLTPFDTREKMRAAMEKAFPAWKQRKVSSSYGQVFRFAHKMSPRDPVVLPVKPTGEIAIGAVTGPYRFASDDEDLVGNDYNNVLPVEWLRTVPRTAFSQAALHSFGSYSSVSTSNDYLEEVVAVLLSGSEDTSDQWDRIATDEREAADEGLGGLDLYESARQETEDYLLKKWRGSGHHFEHVVAALLRAMGYTTIVTQASGDHGIDVIAHPDALGLERPFVKVQVKSGAGSTSEKDVNQLKGALNEGERGLFVSLGSFRSSAEAVGRGSAHITLIDAKRFVELFLRYYNQLEPEWQAKYPLRQTLLPYSLEGRAS